MEQQAGFIVLCDLMILSFLTNKLKKMANNYQVHAINHALYLQLI